MQIEGLIKLITNHKVSGVSCNSQSVRENFIFVAVKGAKEDGSKFIDQALSRGARFVVYAKGVKAGRSKRATFIKVNDTRLALARLAAHFYQHPSKKVKVIGITGTNGKTTVTYLLEAIIKEAGLLPAVIGTINYRFKDKVIRAFNTTPGALELQSMLADMAKEKIDYAAMEVSSHALDQKRISGVNFHSAIFTNLTQDHLDYHKTMKRYFEAKAKLFFNIGPKAFAVINNDDKYASAFKKITPAKIITYALEKKADVSAKDVRFDIRHTEFKLIYYGRSMKLKVNLIGRHNVYNILAAFAWGIKTGIKAKAIKCALEKFSFVPGRLVRVYCRKGFFVFVDYAHTPDALKNILTALRQLSPKRIITVFGCGGERDKLKRPKMGRVVTELSDFVVVTSDNPRSENPGDIAEDIQGGIIKDNYCVILNRRLAIRKALSLAKRGDIVAIAGKGHERYQILKERAIHFDDLEEVKACLKSLNY